MTEHTAQPDKNFLRMPTFGYCNSEVTYEDRRAAYAVIIRGGGVATVKNSRGRYFLPGGGANERERPEETVLREIKEELGCFGRVTRRIGEAEQFFFAASDDRHYRMRAAFFIVELLGDSEALDLSGEEQWCWLAIEDAKEKLYHACHSWALENALSGTAQNHMGEGGVMTVTWDDSPLLPPREQITQSSGVCFTNQGEIVLVSSGNGSWSLPGGHPEAGETAEEALIREVLEEACAVVERCEYLGADRVDDSNRDGPYFQTRWWGRVRLLPFEPKYETTERRLVAPDEFVTTLGWNTAQIARALLDAALSVTGLLDSGVTMNGE